MHAIILDIDGTLLESAADDDALYRQSVANVLGPVRFRQAMHDYDPVTDTGILEQVADDNGIAFDAALLAEVRRDFVDRVAGHIGSAGPFNPLPGASGFLDRLHRSRQAAAAIATGGWGATARLKLETAGIRVAGLPLVSSDDATARTDIMRIALDSLNGPFDSVIYVGDGHWDRQATAELGWVFQPVGPALGGISSFDELAALPAWRWLYSSD